MIFHQNIIKDFTKNTPFALTTVCAPQRDWEAMNDSAETNRHTTQIQRISD